MTADFGVRYRLAFALVLTALLAGCGKSGVERVAVSGNVTFRGEPVPSGIISFTPDAKKGNRGPQGVARIVDGRYSTEDQGRGSVLGPQLVEIRGIGGGQSGRGDSLPFMTGKPLFPPYRTQVEVVEENATIDFEIPDNRTASKPTR